MSIFMSVNGLKTIELYTSKVYILWYENYILLKLSKKGMILFAKQKQRFRSREQACGCQRGIGDGTNWEIGIGI